VITKNEPSFIIGVSEYSKEEDFSGEADLSIISSSAFAPGKSANVWGSGYRLR
jgi:hypothetical protein